MSTTRVNRWETVEWAQRYLADVDEFPYITEGRRALVDLLHGWQVGRIGRVERVLDLGTGDGRTLDLVLGLFPEAVGVGLDFNDEMLERATARFADRAHVEIVPHDLDAALPDIGPFDVVVSSFAIHHCLPTRQRSLYGEVVALLSSGGIFANLEHVASPTIERHHEFLAALGTRPEDDDPSNHLVEPATLAGWLTMHGLAHVEILWKWRELALLTGTRG